MNSAFFHVVLSIVFTGAFVMALIAVCRGARWLGLGFMGSVCVVGSCAASILLLSLPRSTAYAAESHEDPKQATAIPPMPGSDSDPRRALPRPPMPSLSVELDIRHDEPAIAGETRSAATDDSNSVSKEYAINGTEPQSEDDAARGPDKAESSKSSIKPYTQDVSEIRVNEIFPSQRPGPVQVAGQDGWLVVVGPYFSENEGPHELEEALIKAANQYIDERIGRQDITKFLRYDMGAVTERLRYGDLTKESVETEVGQAQYMLATLQFNQSFLDEVNSTWQDAQREARLKQTGFGAGSLLALLATVFGYLKLDTATRGYYTGRLQAGVLIARWIPWI